ncbi:MAG: hypothetical protein HC783_19115 [Rhodobacteraceae bacterium]|nr:hypothetical protein [Paracoccaceae bacterium]
MALRVGRAARCDLADRRGLMLLRRDLRLWAEENALWTPPPLLDRLIRDGLTLAALNEA